MDEVGGALCGSVGEFGSDLRRVRYAVVCAVASATGAGLGRGVDGYSWSAGFDGRERIQVES